MATRFNQGLYTPKHPEKYVGDIKKIRYMSSWELDMHTFYDNNPNILHWSSEPFPIPYVKPTDNKIHKYYPDYWIELVDKEGKIQRRVIELKPTDNKIHKYYPDYWIELVDKEGKIQRRVIELKPAKQTRRPRKNSKSALYESVQFAINVAKWAAATEWCKVRGIAFDILTEKQLYK